MGHKEPMADNNTCTDLEKNYRNQQAIGPKRSNQADYVWTTANPRMKNKARRLVQVTLCQHVYRDRDVDVVKAPG